MQFEDPITSNPSVSPVLEKFFKNYNPIVWDALDIWCWVWQDSKYLADLWYQVDAIDKDGNAISKSIERNSDEKINYMHEDIYEFAFDKKYDLVVSVLSLFYSPKDKQKELFEKIIDSLNAGWMLLIRALWDKDERAEQINRRSLLEIKTYLEQFNNIDVANIDEEFKESPMADGKTKSWHFIDVVIEKR